MFITLSLCSVISDRLCVLHDPSPLQDALEREVSVQNSRTKEVKMVVTGDFYTEGEMQSILNLEPSLGSPKKYFALRYCSYTCLYRSPKLIRYVKMNYA